MYTHTFKKKLKKQFMTGNFEDSYDKSSFLGSFTIKAVFSLSIIAGGMFLSFSPMNFHAGNFIESAQASYEKAIAQNIVYQKVKMHVGRDFIAYIEATLPASMISELKKEIATQDSIFMEDEFESWTTEGKTLTKHNDGLIFLHDDQDFYSNADDFFAMNDAFSDGQSALQVMDIEQDGLIEENILDDQNIDFSTEGAWVVESSLDISEAMERAMNEALEVSYASLSEEELDEIYYNNTIIEGDPSVEGQEDFVEEVMMDGVVVLGGVDHTLSGIKKTEDLLPELQKLVDSGDAEYRGEGEVEGKKAFIYRVDSNFSITHMNGMVEKNHEDFYFDTESKTLLRQVSLASINGTEYEMSVQTIMEEKLLEKEHHKGIFDPLSYNLK